MTESPELAQPRPTAPAPQTPRIESRDLFQGARMVEITHDGATYRLILTRNNRLILQK